MSTETVQMTAAEKADFDKYMADRREKEVLDKRKNDEEAYKTLVDETICRVFPSLRVVSNLLGAIKKQVYDEFNKALEIKGDLYGVKEGQQSHTFTSKEGRLRIILGYNVTDNYDDTVNVGESKVRTYISSLAKDKESETLVNAIFRLLSKDAKTGTLKASRVLQLRKMAEDSGDTNFKDGVRIIEEAYRPALSKQYIKAFYKTDINEWKPIALGVTEVENISLDQNQFDNLLELLNVDVFSLLSVDEKKGGNAGMMANGNRKKESKFTFKAGSKSTTITAYQSPRGVRFDDKRPDSVLIDCYQEFDSVDLQKYIQYLHELVFTIERKNN